MDTFQRTQKSFDKREGRKNFTLFQESLFPSLREDDSNMYALADKGLGPVAVHLPRYIRDGLKHLTDEKSYVIISESQAQEEATKLYSNIMDWTFEHRKSLPDSAVAYIRAPNYKG